MSNEMLYLKATEEVDDGKAEKALWAKSLALVEGDIQKAKYKYINLRVEQLGLEGEDSSSSDKRSTENLEPNLDKSIKDSDIGLNSESDSSTESNYIPLSKYIEVTGRVKENVIVLLESGVREGFLKDGVWFIHVKHLPEQSSEVTEVQIPNTHLRESKKNFIERLYSGDLGLAVTYWVFSVLIGFVLNLAIRVIGYFEISPLYWSTYITSMIYSFSMIFSVFKAADKYQGSVIWAASAKILVSIGGVINFAWLVLIVQMVLNP